MLTGPEIKRQIALGNIVIDPFVDAHVGPNSYDLRLGRTLVLYEDLDMPLRVYRNLATDTLTAQAVTASYETHAQDSEHVILCEGNWLTVLDMAKENPTREYEIPDEGLVLLPGQLYLGHTLEYTETHGFAPRLDGRSSVARLGLSVHLTAGFGDSGFKGTWTLELTVVRPLRVFAGVRVCQIAYDKLDGEPGEYAGKYQGQRKPKPSNLWKDFDAEKKPK